MNLAEDLDDDELILFIENIKLSDIIENNKQNTNLFSLEKDEDEDLFDILKKKSGNNFDKIPTIFTSLKDWIKKTNLKCWYCSLNFDSIPVFLPIYIYKKDNILYQDVHGNFCSFNCVKSYIDLHYNSDDTFIYNQNLLKLYKLFNNKSIVDIDLAPSKFDIDIYGGYMTEDEYKNKLRNLINHEYN